MGPAGAGVAPRWGAVAAFVGSWLEGAGSVLLLLLLAIGRSAISFGAGDVEDAAVPSVEAACVGFPAAGGSSAAAGRAAPSGLVGGMISVPDVGAEP